ncbi:MAG: hypothetical protein ABJK28_11800 [Algibacter sp.]
MSDKKHIDRLFQEKFKDFEKTPDDAVWSNIEAKLNKNKKRRVIPIWWRYAGVAALLLLLLTVGNTFFNPSNSDSNAVEPINNMVDAETEKTQPILETENNNSIKGSSINNDTPVLSDNTLNEQEAYESVLEKRSPKNKEESNFKNNLKETSVIANTPTKNSSEIQKNNNIITNESQVSNHANPSLKESVIANNSLDETQPNHSQSTPVAINNPTEIIKIDEAIKNSNNPVASNKTVDLKVNVTEDEPLIKEGLNKETETIEEAIAKNIDDIEEEKQLNRWNITPNAAPVYFNTLGEGSSIASQFNNNNKTGEVNMSYGINASYAINKKLIVRSGINRVNLGYNTNNVAVFESANATAFSSLASIKGDSSNDAPISSDVTNSNIETDVSLISGESIKANQITPEAFSTASSANINQSLGFIEVPIEFQYIVSDKKLGLNVIGGFSSFFLNNNELFSETNDSRTLIGEAVNVNSVSYSANFGLGLNYKVTKKINLNFEPMFKYQINTFNNTSGDFKPYFIGVYTGIGFKF